VAGCRGLGKEYVVKKLQWEPKKPKEKENKTSLKVKGGRKLLVERNLSRGGFRIWSGGLDKKKSATAEKGSQERECLFPGGGVA